MQEQSVVGIIEQDPWLEPYRSIIRRRMDAVEQSEKRLLEGGSETLSDFADGYLYFGLHRQADGSWILREWAPNASAIYLLCDASQWQAQEAYAFSREASHWELTLPSEALHHGSHYKLLMEWQEGKSTASGERVPAWARYVVQDPESFRFAAVVWEPEEPYHFRHPRAILGAEPLLIYESHIGMATEEEKVGSYKEFEADILPKVVEKGYNAIQLMAIMEHPYYGSFGYQVSSFFAPSSRFGTPDELKSLIDTAHKLGLLVIMDLVHSHAVKNEVEGLAKYDGTHYQFFHSGERMRHPQWDSMCFNYGKPEVIHFLLSNCKYWIEEFQFDGFRFDGVTSMLYLDHGLGQSYTHYSQYYDGQQDEEAITYLTLANKLVHEVYPQAITIAEEVSGMPGLAYPIQEGGYGFDYRLAMNIPDYWIKLIKEQPDEAWKPGDIWWQCTNRREGERSISYAESHDQALVGDKTIFFRLVDKEIYWHMDRADKHLVIDRGMALHKIIRLITLCTTNGGYLTFMGNEFGHPEWIDFPREGNGWSYQHARRLWSLEENGFLKYSQLGLFDKDLLSVVKVPSHFEQLPLQQWWEKRDEQTLAFSRGDLLFVLNLHPATSYTDYTIPLPAGKYTPILCTDEVQYGGHGRVDMEVAHFTTPSPSLHPTMGQIQLYLPSRTALILRKES